MALSAPLVVDGVTYNHVHVASLKRNFQVIDGTNAGRVMSGLMVRDVIGTFYNYSMEIDPDENYPQEYDALYQVLSSPAPSHRIIVPYGQSVLSFSAYITNGSDTLTFMEAVKNRWEGLSVNFIAMSPQRT